MPQGSSVQVRINRAWSTIEFFSQAFVFARKSLQILILTQIKISSLSSLIVRRKRENISGMDDGGRWEKTKRKVSCRSPTSQTQPPPPLTARNNMIRWKAKVSLVLLRLELILYSSQLKKGIRLESDPPTPLQCALTHRNLYSLNSIKIRVSFLISMLLIPFHLS